MTKPENNHNTPNQHEIHHLYRITTGAEELFLGWTTPTRAEQLLSDYRLVFPATSLTELTTDTVSGCWSRAWGGHRAHFWVTDKQTLCGKTHLRPHNYQQQHSLASGKCKECKERHDALLTEREETLTQLTKKGETQCSSR